MSQTTTKRTVVLDTETTGFKPSEHRMVEFAAIELLPDNTFGRRLHLHFNPDQPVPIEATNVHGHTWESLKQYNRFRDHAAEIVSFLRGAEVWAHNAPFDLSHIQAELERANYPATIDEICRFRDSLTASRELLPKQSNYKLDTLLDFFEIDRSERTKHTAILDTELLGKLLICMRKQFDLSLPDLEIDQPRPPIVRINRDHLSALPHICASEDEQRAHQAYLSAMVKETGVPAIGLARRSPRP